MLSRIIPIRAHQHNIAQATHDLNVQSHLGYWRIIIFFLGGIFLMRAIPKVPLKMVLLVLVSGDSFWLY